MNDLLDKDLIFVDSKEYTKNEILEKMGQVMIDKGYAQNEYIKALIDREEEFSTGIPVNPVGIAIPHTDSSFVKQNKMGVMILNDFVEFGEMGGNDTVLVKIVILLGFSEGNYHLKALQSIIQLIQDEDFVAKLSNARSKETVYKLLNNNLELNLEEDAK